MKKKNKNIDELFREKLNSEKPVLPFHKADWELLEQKLDLAISHRRNIFLFKTLGGIAAILLLFFAIWFVSRSDQQSAKKGQETLLTDQNKTKINPETIVNPKVVQSNDSIKNNLKGQYKNNISSRPDQEIKLTSTKKNKRETNGNVYRRRQISTLPSDVKPLISLSATIASKAPAQYPDQFKELQIPPLYEVQSTQPNKRPQKNVALSVLVAPSFNGVGNFKNVEMGKDVGLMISLDLTKRLRISTGAIYAKKLYESAFNKASYPTIGGYGKGDYGNGGYNNSVSSFPESVYADCRVLDIPINVDYTLFSKGKHTVSIGTGVSSYIMLKEKYQFEYPNPSNTNANNLELTNENQHLLGILNFQASYTRQLNSKIGLSIQPFLKIPMVDVGYSKVKLQSAGMALNLQWNLSSK